MSLVNSRTDPLTLLALQTQGQQPPGVAPSAGSETAAAPAPATPAPAPASPPQGGGRPSPFSNIGTRISNAMSGGGLLSDPNAAPDNEIDPVTGIPRAITQRANNQSMMKMGLMLMAAGQFQSDDSRARILAAVPGAADNTETINSFARNRLEMAKVRLLERQQMQEAAQQAAMSDYISANTMGGGGGLPTAASAPGAPVTGETQGVAGTPLAEVAPSAPMAPETAPVAPPAMAPNVQGPPMPQAAAPAPDGGPQLPPQSPIPPNVTPLGTASADSLSSTPPAAPTIPRMSFTPQEAALLKTLPLAEQRKEILRKEQATQTQELQSEPYIRSGVGVVVDVYKGGQKIGTQKIGDVGTQLISREGQNGVREFLTVGDDGRIQDIKVIRDPVADAERTRQNERENPSLPSGYVLDPSDPTGRAIMPAPGSKEERERLAEDAAKERRAAESGTQADIVLQDVDRALTLFEDTKDNWFPAVGPTSGLLSVIPQSNAAQMERVLTGLRSNIARDTLNRMRQSSPTGGALGNTSDRDIQLLEDAYGRVTAAATPEEFEYQMSRLRNQYLDVIHGAGEGPDRIDLSRLAGAPRPAGRRQENAPAPAQRAPTNEPDPARFGAPSGPVPDGITPEEWEFMRPEDRKLFQ